jgi:hypothetical protein
MDFDLKSKESSTFTVAILNRTSLISKMMQTTSGGIRLPYCRKCGSELKEDMKFCPKCGTAISPRAAREREHVDWWR